MELKVTDVSGFMRLAALVAQDINAALVAQEPESASQLAQQVNSGGAQMDLRIRDLLGGMPRIDLVAVSAAGEVVVGSRLCQRRQSGEA